jgi:hypothetical protein
MRNLVDLSIFFHFHVHLLKLATVDWLGLIELLAREMAALMWYLGLQN